MSTLILYPSDLKDPSKGVSTLSNIKDEATRLNCSGCADLVIFKSGRETTVLKSIKPSYITLG